MGLLGWPRMNTNMVSERELKSLTGESIHLGCKALFFGSVFCDPTAPWWGRNAASSSVLEASSGPEGGPAPRRRRRIAPVKSMT